MDGCPEASNEASVLRRYCRCKLICSVKVMSLCASAAARGLCFVMKLTLRRHKLSFHSVFLFLGSIKRIFNQNSKTTVVNLAHGI